MSKKSKRKGVTRKSFFSYKDTEEKVLFYQRFLKCKLWNVVPDILVFPYPTQGYHASFYVKQNGSIGSYIKNDKIGVRIPLNKAYPKILSEVLKEKRLL